VGGHGRRHGTGEVKIVAVDLLDAYGIPQVVFETHQPLTVRMHYVATQPVQRPVFGLGIHHEGGFWITGPNTSFDSFDIDRIQGRGYVDLIIPDLPLIIGNYLISVAVVDDTMLRTFDHHDRAYRLVVQSSTLAERYGVLSLQRRWAWSEQTTLDHAGGRLEPG
jgi:lipopolysaccharide transport system ATP-binding protein